MAFKWSIEAAEFVPSFNRNPPLQFDAHQLGKSATNSRPKQETSDSNIRTFDHVRSNIHGSSDARSFNMSAPEFVPFSRNTAPIQRYHPEKQSFTGTPGKNHQRTKQTQDKQRYKKFNPQNTQQIENRQRYTSFDPQRKQDVKSFESQKWMDTARRNQSEKKSKVYETDHGPVAFASKTGKAKLTVESTSNISHPEASCSKSLSTGKGGHTEQEDKVIPKAASSNPTDKAQGSGNASLSWSKVVQSQSASRKMHVIPKDHVGEEVHFMTTRSQTGVKRQSDFVEGRPKSGFQRQVNRGSASSGQNSRGRGKFSFISSGLQNQRRDVMYKSMHNQFGQPGQDGLEWRRDSAQLKREAVKGRSKSQMSTSNHWRESRSLWKIVIDSKSRHLAKDFRSQLNEKLHKYLKSDQTFVTENLSGKLNTSSVKCSRGWYNMDWNSRSDCKEIDLRIGRDRKSFNNGKKITEELSTITKNIRSTATCESCGQSKTLPNDVESKVVKRQGQKYCDDCQLTSSAHKHGPINDDDGNVDQISEKDDGNDGWVTVEVKPKRKVKLKQEEVSQAEEKSYFQSKPRQKDNSSFGSMKETRPAIKCNFDKDNIVKRLSEDNKETKGNEKNKKPAKKKKKSSKRKENTLYENDQKKIKEFKMRQMIEENLKLDLLELTKKKKPKDEYAGTDTKTELNMEWPSIGKANVPSVNILSFAEALKSKAPVKRIAQTGAPRTAGIIEIDPENITKDQKMELKRKKLKEKKRLKKKEQKERKRAGAENVEIDTGNAASARKTPFTLDLGDMFDKLLKPSVDEREPGKGHARSSKHVVFSAGVISVASGLAKKNKADGSKPDTTKGRSYGNASDPNQHVKISGKERETPKARRPTMLKRVILRAREAKRKEREAEMKKSVEKPCEKDDGGKSQVDEDVLSIQKEEVTHAASEGSAKEAETIENVNEEDSSLKVEEELKAEDSQGAEGVVMAPPLTDLPEDIVAKLHSRKFREYCDQLLSKDIDQIVYKMLKDLLRFQTRAYVENPIKAKAKKRLVLGIREVARQLKMSRLKCVVIAPNLEKISNEGGIDSYLGKIIFDCKQFSIPVIYSMTRQALGMILKRKVPVSAVGILNYAGVEDDYKQLCALVKEQREKYERRVEEIKAQDTEPRSEETNRSSTRGTRHKTHQSVARQQEFVWNPEVVPFVPQGVMYNYYTSNLIATKFTFNNT